MRKTAAHAALISTALLGFAALAVAKTHDGSTKLPDDGDKLPDDGRKPSCSSGVYFDGRCLTSKLAVGLAVSAGDQLVDWNGWNICYDEDGSTLNGCVQLLVSRDESIYTYTIFDAPCEPGWCTKQLPLEMDSSPSKRQEDVRCYGDYKAGMRTVHERETFAAYSEQIPILGYPSNRHNHSVTISHGSIERPTACGWDSRYQVEEVSVWSYGSQLSSGQIETHSLRVVDSNGNEVINDAHSLFSIASSTGTANTFQMCEARRDSIRARIMDASHTILQACVDNISDTVNFEIQIELLWLKTTYSEKLDVCRLQHEGREATAESTASQLYDHCIQEPWHYFPTHFSAPPVGPPPPSGGYTPRNFGYDEVNCSSMSRDGVYVTWREFDNNGCRWDCSGYENRDCFGSSDGTCTCFVEVEQTVCVGTESGCSPDEPL